MGQYKVRTATLELTAEYFKGNAVPKIPTRMLLKTAVDKYMAANAVAYYAMEFDTLDSSKAYFDNISKKLDMPELIGRKKRFWAVDIVEWQITDTHGIGIILSSCSSIDNLSSPTTIDRTKKAPSSTTGRKYIRIPLDVNATTEADIINWLNQQPNRNGYIKRLIYNDMMRSTLFEGLSDCTMPLKPVKSNAENQQRTNNI